LAKLADSTTSTSQVIEAARERKELALGSWRQGQYENALILIDSVLAEGLPPGIECELWVTRATFKGELGQFAESLDSLNQAARLLDFADAKVKASFYFERARCHKELGRFDESLTDYAGAEAYIERAGIDRSFVENNLAGLYLKAGDFERAHTHVNRAIALNQINLPKAYETQAEIYFAEGQLDRALESINHAIAIVGENESWLRDFLKTKDGIDARLLELLGVTKIADLEKLRADMTRRALVEFGGNLSRAGEKLGLKHKGVDWIISKHPELEQYRKQRTTRLKSILKKTK